MHKKSMYKAIIAIAVALAFVMPGSAAFANVGTIGIAPNIENTGDMETMAESTNSDNSYDYTEDTIVTEETIDTAILSTGNTIYVDDDRPPEWYNETQVRTIQEGVDNATAGDTVYVYNGTYYENVLVNKTVNLIGESRENVIVDGGGSGRVFHVKTINDVSIDSFAVTNGRVGIRLTSSSDNNISNCNIYNHSWGGIELKFSPNNNIINCNVHNNRGKGGIIFFKESSSNTRIINCNSYNNSGHGIYLTSSSTAITIDNCDSYNNNYGFYLDSSSHNNNITNCNVYDNNRDGIYLTSSSYNNIINCNSYNNSWYGIYFKSSSYNNIINCNVYDNTYNGILSSSSDDNSIINCNSYNNSWYGIYLESSSNCDIINCTVYDTYSGIYLWISSNNSIIDCNAYNNDEYGIYLDSSSYNNITNCDIYYNMYGTYLYNSSNCDIINCTVYNNTYSGIYLWISSGMSSDNSILNCSTYNNNEYGICLDSSSDCKLIGNTIYDNAYNFFVDGLDMDHFYHDIDTSNTVNGKPIYYLVEESDLVLDGEISSIGYLGLISCTNITAKNIDINIVLMIGTTKSTISKVSAHDSGTGFYLFQSSDNDIINCDAYNNEYGIYLTGSSNNNITNCNAYNNSQYGIYLTGSSNNNNIINCNAYDNKYDIYLESSSNSKLRDNTISDNFGVEGTSTSHFYHDIDISNTIKGKPIYYLVEQSNMTIDGIELGYLALIACTNITVKNIDVTGVLVIETIDSTISNVDSHDSGIGIYLWTSSDNNIIDCDIYNSGIGIYLKTSSDNNIIDCDIYSNSGNAIELSYSPKNNITQCSLYNNNGRGMYVASSSDSNNITNCNIYNNSGVGINLRTSSDNNIIDCDIYTNSGNAMTISYSPKNNIMQCNLHNNNGRGIYVERSSDSNITNCDIYNNTYGIFTYDCFSNIANCNVYNNMDGINLGYRSTNKLRDNIIYDNVYNLQVGGDLYQQDIDISNTVDGKPIYFLINEKNIILDESNNFGYLGLIGCTNITAKNGDVTGIVMAGTTDSTIFNVNSHDSAGHGIVLSESSNNNIINCNLYNNKKHGIDSVYSLSNDITDCNIYNNDWGIYLHSHSDDNVIIGCDIHDNNYGIMIGSWSYGLLVHHNNFVNNGQNADDGNQDQYYDDGSEGNYWDDYTGIDEDGDGIGDTPYIVPGHGNNQDRFPLMKILDDTPPIITDVLATPEIQNTTKPVNITCTVTDNFNMVDIVKINITGPEGFTLEEEMNEGYWYEYTYTTMGDYDYYIWANDTIGNIAVSDIYSFVIMEFDKPISVVAPLPQWTKTIPFTVTATAFDNTGVENVTLWYRYSTNGTEWTDWTSYGTDEEAPWSWSFTGVDGCYEFYSIAVDDYENVEDPPDVADASTGIDTVPPVTTIILDGTMGDNDWYVSSVTVTLSASDTLSGIESTWYRLDSGYWKLYVGLPFTVSSAGQHTVECYSVDRAGNREDTKSVSFKIDKTLPTTTHKFDGVIGKEGWFVSDVTVTLSATDATSGVNYTKYKIDDGTWMNYTESFDVTEDGDHTLYYYSVDLAGNIEPTNEVDFKIEHDVLPPVTIHNFSGIMGDNDWFVSDVTVTLTAVDDSSGVDYTMYKLDDGEWEGYTGPFLVTEDGEHTIEYYSVDKVGNKENDSDPFDFKIDQTDPTIELAVEKTGLIKWLLTATVSDETSGIAEVEFYLDGEYLGNATEPPYEWEVTKKGTARAIVYDNAGNEVVSDEVPVSYSQSQIQSSSNLVPVQRGISLISLGGLTGIQNIQRRV